MSKSKYPLIKFTQRTQDNLRTEGGGGGKPPKWILNGQELNNKSQKLIYELESLRTELKKYPPHIPHAIEVRFIDDAKAKSHQGLIVGMFKSTDNMAQIGMSGENRIIVNIDSENSLDKIITNVKNTYKFQNPISAIEEIQVFLPKMKKAKKRSNSNKEVYKLNFLDFQNPDINKSIETFISDKLLENEIEFTVRKYNEEEKIIEIRESNYDKLVFVKELPVKSMEPMEITESPFPILDTSLKNVVLESYNPELSYPLIGLLDSGVDINKYTEDWVKRGNGCNYSDSELDKNHGTFIASLMIHGNQLNSCLDYSINGCLIVDVPVVPKFSIDEVTLIKNIRNAIENNPDVKVWNLSVSLSGEISTEEFSSFASALDKIQDEYKVLICKSAGNDSAFYTNNESGLLSIGAESVRSLTIGSINRKNDKFGFCKENYPAPYSRMGRGPGFIIKPELVHFGGDVFSKISSPKCENDYEFMSEKSFSTGGKSVTHVGTSFSTPKIAKNVAELDLNLTEEFDPLLLKALVTHSAAYLESPSLDEDLRLKKIGYGKPLNSDEILFSENPYSSTLILKGNLKKGEKIDIMDFPYPKNLIEDDRFKGQIKATLVYKNYLEEDLGPEYCQSDINLKFGTYSEKFDRDTNKSTILNPIGRSENENLLLRSAYSKKLLSSNNQYETERTLIQYGDKYYPVKKFAIDLKELKNSVSKKSLKKNRLWFLHLEGRYRDFIVNKAKKKNEILSMDYCVIITISDPEKKVNVYNGTIQELAINNFEYSNIEVDNEVSININKD